MNTATAVRAHSRAKPYAALKAAVCKDLIFELQWKREAHFQAEMKKLDRALGRLVRHLVRQETQ